MAEFKVGLIGLGEISSYFINAVNLHPRMQMVAVCRRRPQPGDKEKYSQYTFYTEWKELVEDPAVNTIIIATPPSTHAAITRCALKLHKRVISEKPFSLDLADAIECTKLAKETKTHLNFAYHAAMNPLSLLAKDRIGALVAKGDKITNVNVVYKEHVQNYHDGQSWIFDPAVSGGGVLIDSGVNAISVVQHVCGKVEPTAVKLGFEGSTFKGELVQDWIWPGEETRQITVSLESGSIVSFCFAKGSITTTGADGNSVTEQVINKENTDVHLTPMSLEYINVVNFAVEGFDKEEFVDDLGDGPFEFVMQCYKMNSTKA